MATKQKTGRPSDYLPEVAADICSLLADGGVAIYGLYCPVTGEIRYVGKSRNPKARFQQHISDRNRKRTPSACWIRSLVNRGMVPVMKIHCVVGFDEWEQAEIEEIAKQKSSGANLLNISIGGNHIPMTAAKRVKNASLMNSKRADTPEKRKLYELKREFGQLKYFFEKNGMTDALEKHKERMKLLAVCRPDLFGSWGYLLNE